MHRLLMSVMLRHLEFYSDCEKKMMEEFLTIHQLVYYQFPQPQWFVCEQEAVAVKCIAKSKLAATESATRQFLQDIDNLTTVDHPHVVQLFGLAISNDSFMLVPSLLLPLVSESILVVFVIVKDSVYGAVIVAMPLWEFTGFIWRPPTLGPSWSAWVNRSWIMLV